MPEGAGRRVCRVAAGELSARRGVPGHGRSTRMCRAHARANVQPHREPRGAHAPSPAAVPCRHRHTIRIDPLISKQELNMTDVVIVSAARTAVGKFGGSLAKIAA
ncbi:hypothetical protein C6Q14_21210, partial [Burkholderia ambifaria]